VGEEVGRERYLLLQDAELLLLCGDRQVLAFSQKQELRAVVLRQAREYRVLEPELLARFGRESSETLALELHDLEALRVVLLEALVDSDPLGEALEVDGLEVVRETVVLERDEGLVVLLLPLYPLHPSIHLPPDGLYGFSRNEIALLGHELRVLRVDLLEESRLYPEASHVF